MQLAVPTRFRTRTIVVITTVLMLVFATLAAPARAGEGDGDAVEAARAAALETVNYKINSLKEYREGAKTDQAWAIYSEGIEELGDIKARILEEDNTGEIWALRDQAKAVWAETKARAAAADAGDKDDGDDGDDDDGKEDEDAKKDDEARHKADDEAKRRKDRDKAEAAFAEARERTLSLIDKKVGLMSAASQAARHRQVSDIYRLAAAAIAELRPQAEEPGSIDELEKIANRVWEIIHEAKKVMAELGNDRDKSDKREYDDEKDGKDNDGTDEEDNDGTDGKDNDGTDEEDNDGTDEEEDDGAEETATILIGLNAMELEVDNYQIAIQNTMVPEPGIGFPEGPIALTAGSNLLDAIDAARTLTGDELAVAWADVKNQHSAYIQAVMAYDRAWNVGLFAGSIVVE